MKAVEFIVYELNKEMGLISFVTGTEESYKSAIFSIIERAKEMEKQQIMNAWDDGQSDGATICTQKADNPSEEYYNKTFKLNK